MITKELLNEKLASIIEEEYEEEVILLDQTEEMKRTVSVEIFVVLFEEADFTYESLTQEKYEPYRYKPFFDLWKEQGLLE
ncbi:MAG: hypothetical protein ABTA16_01605 [Niallia sp.]|nr:Uncharacterised protein [Mycobacteroides abscessus subsp. abscessus]